MTFFFYHIFSFCNKMCNHLLYMHLFRCSQTRTRFCHCIFNFKVNQTIVTVTNTICHYPSIAYLILILMDYSVPMSNKLPRLCWLYPLIFPGVLFVLFIVTPTFINLFPTHFNVITHHLCSTTLLLQAHK